MTHHDMHKEDQEGQEVWEENGTDLSGTVIGGYSVVLARGGEAMKENGTSQSDAAGGRRCPCFPLRIYNLSSETNYYGT